MVLFGDIVLYGSNEFYEFYGMRIGLGILSSERSKRTDASGITHRGFCSLTV